MRRPFALWSPAFLQERRKPRSSCCIRLQWLRGLRCSYNKPRHSTFAGAADPLDLVALRAQFLDHAIAAQQVQRPHHHQRISATGLQPLLQAGQPGVVAIHIDPLVQPGTRASSARPCPATASHRHHDARHRAVAGSVRRPCLPAPGLHAATGAARRCSCCRAW